MRCCRSVRAGAAMRADITGVALASRRSAVAILLDEVSDAGRGGQIVGDWPYGAAAGAVGRLGQRRDRPRARLRRRQSGDAGAPSVAILLASWRSPRSAAARLRNHRRLCRFETAPRRDGDGPGILRAASRDGTVGAFGGALRAHLLFDADATRRRWHRRPRHRGSPHWHDVQAVPCRKARERSPGGALAARGFQPARPSRM